MKRKAVERAKNVQHSAAAVARFAPTKAMLAARTTQPPVCLEEASVAVRVRTIQSVHCLVNHLTYDGACSLRMFKPSWWQPSQLQWLESLRLCGLLAEVLVQPSLDENLELAVAAAGGKGLLVCIHIAWMGGCDVQFMCACVSL